MQQHNSLSDVNRMVLSNLCLFLTSHDMKSLRLVNKALCQKIGLMWKERFKLIFPHLYQNYLDAYVNSTESFIAWHQKYEKAIHQEFSKLSAKQRALWFKIKENNIDGLRSFDFTLNDLLGAKPQNQYSILGLILRAKDKRIESIIIDKIIKNNLLKYDYSNENMKILFSFFSNEQLKKSIPQDYFSGLFNIIKQFLESPITENSMEKNIMLCNLFILTHDIDLIRNFQECFKDKSFKEKLNRQLLFSSIKNSSEDVITFLWQQGISDDQSLALVEALYNPNRGIFNFLLKKFKTNLDEFYEKKQDKDGFLREVLTEDRFDVMDSLLGSKNLSPEAFREIACKILNLIIEKATSLQWMAYILEHKKYQVFMSQLSMDEQEKLIGSLVSRDKFQELELFLEKNILDNEVFYREYPLYNNVKGSLAFFAIGKRKLSLLKRLINKDQEKAKDLEKTEGSNILNQNNLLAWELLEFAITENFYPAISYLLKFPKIQKCLAQEKIFSVLDHCFKSHIRYSIKQVERLNALNFLRKYELGCYVTNEGVHCKVSHGFPQGGPSEFFISGQVLGISEQLVSLQNGEDKILVSLQNYEDKIYDLALKDDYLLLDYSRTIDILIQQLIQQGYGAACPKEISWILNMVSDILKRNPFNRQMIHDLESVITLFSKNDAFFNTSWDGACMVHHVVFAMIEHDCGRKKLPSAILSEERKSLLENLMKRTANLHNYISYEDAQTTLFDVIVENFCVASTAAFYKVFQAHPCFQKEIHEKDCIKKAVYMGKHRMFMQNEKFKKMLAKERNGKPSLLHHAIDYGRYQTAKDLIEAKANVSLQDEMGNTPLFLVQSSKMYSIEKKAIISLLIKNKADINALNNKGRTPLYAAVLDYVKENGSRLYNQLNALVVKFLKIAKAHKVTLNFAVRPKGTKKTLIEFFIDMWEKEKEKQKQNRKDKQGVKPSLSPLKLACLLLEVKQGHDISEAIKKCNSLAYKKQLEIEKEAEPKKKTEPKKKNKKNTGNQPKINEKWWCEELERLRKIDQEKDSSSKKRKERELKNLSIFTNKKTKCKYQNEEDIMQRRDENSHDDDEQQQGTSCNIIHTNY